MQKSIKENINLLEDYIIIYKPEDVSGYQFFHNLHVKKIIKLLKMFLRNQEKGIFSKELNGLKLKGKDIFNLKYFDDNILGKILRSNKEKYTIMMI